MQSTTGKPASDRLDGPSVIAKWLEDGARISDTHDAIVFPDFRLSYAELLANSRRMAAKLKALGVRPGDHVGLLFNNSRTSIEMYLGTLLANAVAVFLNARYKSEELPHTVNKGDMRVLFTAKTDGLRGHTDIVLDAFPELRKRNRADRLRLQSAPRLERVFALGDDLAPPFLSFDEDFLNRPSAFGLDPDAPIDHAPEGTLALLFTSGTTSHPKACPVRASAMLGKASDLADSVRLTPASAFWNPLPGFHIGFLMPFMAALSRGATTVTTEHFNALETLQLLSSEKVTHVHPGFYTIWSAVLNHPQFDQYDLSHIHTVICSGPTEALRLAEEKLPRGKILNTYGSSESAGSITMSHPDDDFQSRASTAGYVLPGNEMRIVSPDDGTVLAVDEMGEIQLRGATVFDGYYKDAAKSAEALSEDGWFKTGDLGSLDSEGRIRITGRLKDMLKVGGENVAAVEVEGFLTTHPAVALAQVIGVEDPRLMEVPAAFIELKPGSTLDPVELIEFCRGRIAGYKIPRYVVFISEWPASATKIQKHRLAELPLGERLYDSATR
ncbi:MAG: class I adenylate-forming enzyme family protein [Flavobacteriaceae bacterium]